MPREGAAPSAPLCLAKKSAIPREGAAPSAPLSPAIKYAIPREGAAPCHAVALAKADVRAVAPM